MLNLRHIIDRSPFDKSSVLRRVLIMRPEPGATETAARLNMLGFSPIIAPIFSIVTRDVYAPGHVAATLLTSRHAIAACSPFLHDRPVFTVGTATAARASEAGFRRVFSADGDSEALVSIVSAKMSPKKDTLFLPAGQGQGMAMAASLRQRGFAVLRRVAYRTVRVLALPEAIATLLRQHQLAVAMFFSAESSRHFVNLLQAAHLSDVVRHVEAVSISERTAVALRPLPWRRISVAATPNQDAMLVLLK